MPGIVRQADQYGLDAPRDLYASVPESEIADLLRSGPRIHAGTMSRVSRETLANDPNHGGAEWEEFSKTPGKMPITHAQDPTIPILPGGGMSF